MKYDVMVETTPGKRHGYRLPFEGVLHIHLHIRGYEEILGPGLEHLHPKIVSVKPQLALPYYPPSRYTDADWAARYPQQAA